MNQLKGTLWSFMVAFTVSTKIHNVYRWGLTNMLTAFSSSYTLVLVIAWSVPETWFVLRLYYIRLRPVTPTLTPTITHAWNKTGFQLNCAAMFFVFFPKKTLTLLLHRLSCCIATFWAHYCHQLRVRGIAWSWQQWYKSCLSTLVYAFLCACRRYK